MEDKKKILIIEDEIDFANMVKLRLESVGYEVSIVEDAHKGTQEIIKGDYDLVVLDLKIPEGGGFSVFRRMRRFPGKTRVPVVILTGQEITDKVKEMAKAYNASGIFTKPLDSKEFVNTIVSLVPL